MGFISEVLLFGDEDRRECLWLFFSNFKLLSIVIELFYILLREKKMLLIKIDLNFFYYLCYDIYLNFSGIIMWKNMYLEYLKYDIGINVINVLLAIGREYSENSSS